MVIFILVSKIRFFLTFAAAKCFPAEPGFKGNRCNSGTVPAAVTVNTHCDFAFYLHATVILREGEKSKTEVRRPAFCKFD